MTSRPAKRKYLLFGGVFFLFIILIITALFILYRRRQQNDITVFQNYRIDYAESAADSSELLNRLCRDVLQLSMRRASDSSHLFLKLADSVAEAEKFGFSLRETGEKGFLIIHYGNTVYLLSPTSDGLRRACFYLVYHLVDGDGRLLLAMNEKYVDPGLHMTEDILVGETSIADYSVVCGENVPASCGAELLYYINQTCGALPNLTAEAQDSPSIRLSVDGTLSAGSCRITGANGDLTIAGADPDSLAAGIRQFANTYLHWAYAGTDRASRPWFPSSIHIPSEITPAESPWVREREAIITLWKLNYNRGIFYNTATSLKNDLMSFSETQLYDYVRMLKYCGFTGIQVTDMCAAWAAAGNYEYVHERIRILADAAHSLDMNFTLWVWGTAFTGFGWIDNTVSYRSSEYELASQDPSIRETFEKYYSIYAELADCCDRVIMHVYDPGFLGDSEDVAYFSGVLADKFRAVNPDIDFGINCIVDAYNKHDYLSVLGSDITLYSAAAQSDTASFRTFCKDTGCRYGTMAWNTCEMELDQIAQMNYNPHLIQSTYLHARQYDEILEADYWGEMDCYHILNVFSLYCAGQMLIDPDREPEELTHEIALATVGEEYADAFADILSLIEDARTGESWDTYWWQSPDFILKSDAYPADEILAESERAIAVLQEMIAADVTANTLPLPLELSDVLRLMLPHIQQIHDFALFRIGLSQAKDMAAQGSPKDAIQTQIDSISTPISEYNAVIGLWGQVEARAQRELILSFCRDNGLEIPLDATFDYERKFRIYSQFIADQKGRTDIAMQYPPYYQYGLAYDTEETERLVRELVEEGIFSVDEATGGLYLTDWQHYSHSFN